MKKYDIYGIGNAIVDIVVDVNDDFLEKNRIEKGIMTLVDEKKQQVLMNSSDFTIKSKQCGGSAANTLIGISQLGGKSYFSCKVANDDYGKFYLEDLKALGVDTNFETQEKGITGKCLVLTTPDAKRTMNTYLGISSFFSINEIDEYYISQSSYIYIEGYLVSNESALEAVLLAKNIAKKQDTKIAMTFSDSSMVKYFRSEWEKVFTDPIDLLFCNEEEVKLYSNKENLKDACAYIKKIATKFVVTLGDEGALIFDGKQYHQIDSVPTHAIDTTGAGDVFAGVFMYGIMYGYSYPEAANMAAHAASKLVSKYGPRLDTHEIKSVVIAK